MHGHGIRGAGGTQPPPNPRSVADDGERRRRHRRCHGAEPAARVQALASAARSGFGRGESRRAATDLSRARRTSAGGGRVVAAIPPVVGDAARRARGTPANDGGRSVTIPDNDLDYGRLDRADDGRWMLCFTRTLPHAPQKVWRALTEP